jgi:CheY-specific phosphatase CheX
MTTLRNTLTNFFRITLKSIPISYSNIYNDVLARVAQSVSPEIKQIISQNVQGLVGMLPAENFNVQITTDRDNLAGLLASAMMTGYFLRQMEQRMQLEQKL